MECEKLAQEKTEMQRHYVMVSKCSLECEIDRISELHCVSIYRLFEKIIPYRQKILVKSDLVILYNYILSVSHKIPHFLRLFPEK